MRNDEKVEEYLLKIDETINGIRGLGETINDIDVVKKILRYLPDKFDSKICSIEETRDIDQYTMEDIHGALVAYEMRKLQTGIHKQRSNIQGGKESEESFFRIKRSDVLEVHLSRKLNKGAGKYKGKLPFKFFNCGKIGHFASKCPYNIHDEVDDEKEKSSKTNSIK